MKTHTLFIILLVALYCNTSHASPEQQAIFALEKQRVDALINRDITVLEKITALDAVHITTTGERRTGEEWLSNRRKATVPFKQFILLDDRTVRFIENVAIVEGSYANSKTVGDDETPLKHARYTRIYQRRDAGWVMIHHQATTIDPPS